MKKFLLITYYWPPCGGVSVQRWLKLTKYLPQCGWYPTVLTTENGDYPFIDESLSERVSKDVKVIRTKTIVYNKIFQALLGKKEKLPYASLKTDKKDPILKKLIYFTRIQCVSPDARIVWNNKAFKAAEYILRAGKYSAIITSGPPHSTHLIGLRLKKKYGIRWIADFRDPWSAIHYHENENRNIFIKSLDKNLEKKVLKFADTVVTVSDKVAETFLTSKQINIIPNAFDPDDFKTNYKRDDKFRIKFVGALFDDRKEYVLRVMDWIEEITTNPPPAPPINVGGNLPTYIGEGEGGRNIEFTLIGAFEEIPENIKKRFQYLKIRNLPFLKHEKVIEECIDSEILILVIAQSPNNAGILTYKLFEYIGSQTFILGIGPENSDVQNILEKTRAGALYSYQAKADFLNKFKELYYRWQNHEDLKNYSDVSEFSLPSICQKYKELLEFTIR